MLLSIVPLELSNNFEFWNVSSAPIWVGKCKCANECKQKWSVQIWLMVMQMCVCKYKCTNINVQKSLCKCKCASVLLHGNSAPTGAKCPASPVNHHSDISNDYQHSFPFSFDFHWFSCSWDWACTVLWILPDEENITRQIPAASRLYRCIMPSIARYSPCIMPSIAQYSPCIMPSISQYFVS